jgi:hypothetical protein
VKALSIKQPWSWLIVNGHKDIENRDWPTRFRGEVFIHAGKTFDSGSLGAIQLTLNYLAFDGGKTIILPDKFEMGGIVGIAEIVDCVDDSDSPWFVGEYGFVLRSARPLPFTPLRGQLGFFDVPNEVTKPILGKSKR